MNGKAHGLDTGSQLPSPELLPGSNTPPDVCIRYGPVPSALAEPLAQGRDFQATPDTFSMTVRDIARFRVAKAKEILVNRHPNCHEVESTAAFAEFALRRPSAAAKPTGHPPRLDPVGQSLR